MYQAICTGAYSGFEVRGREMWSGRSSAEGHGGAEGADGGGVWGQKKPPPGKVLACSPSKWCVLMHSGARFRQTRL